MRPWVVLLISSLLLSAAPPSTGSAQEPTISDEERERDARALFAMASRHYETGRLAEAIDEFSRAYALFPLADLQYNLYLAHRDSGNTAEAAAALALYLESAEDVEAERRASLERRLELLQASAAEADAQTETATQTDTHTDTQTDPDIDTQTDTDIAAPPQDRPEEASSGGISPVIGGIVTGVGGALLVGSLVAALLANGKKSELDDLCAMSGDANVCPAQQQAEIVSSFETNRNVAWGLLYAGAATAVTGVVLLLLSGGGDDEDTPTASVDCTGQGCVGTLRGTF